MLDDDFKKNATSKLVLEVLQSRNHQCIVLHSSLDHYPLDFSWCYCDKKCANLPLTYLQYGKVKVFLLDSVLSGEYSDTEEQEFFDACYKNPPKLFSHLSQVDMEDEEYKNYYKRDIKEYKEIIEETWKEYKEYHLTKKDAATDGDTSPLAGRLNRFTADPEQELEGPSLEKPSVNTKKHE